MKPLLSIVLVGRNDNYGGDFKVRLQNCIKQLHQNLTSAEIKSEIIFVCYNPLPDEVEIDKFIDWPTQNEYVSTKVVVVANHIHKDFIAQNSQVIDYPVLEYFAKNIGIRRATGEFVLCMNPDILIDEKNYSMLKNLNPSFFYRADRVDFDSNTQEYSIEIAQKNVTNIRVKAYTRKFSPPIHLNKFWFWEAKFRALVNIIVHRIVYVLNPIWSKKHHPKFEFSYHCNASGDFMLMSRKSWFDIGGYKENASVIIHTDSLMVAQAVKQGLKQKVLKFPIYHKDHSRNFESNSHQNIYLEFQATAQKIMNGKLDIQMNVDFWGLKKRRFANN